MKDWTELWPDYVTRSGQIKRNTPKNIRTDIFVYKAKQVHGEEYDYSKTVCINSTAKVTVTCKIHGDFQVIPHNHLRGSKCARCNGNIKLTEQEFIRRAKGILGESFDFEGFKTVNDKVTCICPEHGKWVTDAKHILYDKTGCPRCAGNIKRTDEEIIQEALKVHGDKYDYSKLRYTRKDEKVIIVCAEHGEFSQYVQHHLKGTGCPECAHKEYGNLYLIKYEGLGYKIGITKNVERRVVQLSSGSPVPIELIKSWSMPNTKEVEEYLLKTYTSKLEDPTLRFPGYTELRVLTDKEVLDICEYLDRA